VNRGARMLIVKFTLCTLAGAVVTWVVAWGFALWGTMSETGSETFRSRDEIRRRSVEGGVPPSSMNVSWLTVSEWSGTGVRLAAGDLTEVVVDDLRISGWRHLSCGWPAHALDCHTAQISRKPPLVKNLWVAPQWVGSTGSGRSLPYAILPLGFALNTLLAAVVFLGLVQGFAFARRRVRRANGRCPSCGYDRAGITMDVACPECGGDGS
jgi:hypothetical protein